ncbi:MAG: universal stress protein, partial [Nitrospirota bacterium]
MNIKHILVGVDFGPATDAVLAYAAHFAAATGSSLNLLHVIDYLITPPAYLAPYMEKEKEAAEENFTFLKKYLAEKGIGSETEVVVGRLHESFTVALEKAHADMVILGFVAHVFRRSSSEKLIKGLEVPMLVVRGEKADAARSGHAAVKKILCPVDLSDQSRKALAAAKELKAIFDGDLEVLSVIP